MDSEHVYPELQPQLYTVEEHTTELPNDVSSHWNGHQTQAMNTYNLKSFPDQSARSSSSSSSTRLSSNSVFSQQGWRDSIASTSTTWSNVSQGSREYYVSQAQHALSAESPASFKLPAELGLEAVKPAAIRYTARRSVEPEKDQSSTCVSRTKRTRRSTKEPRYWCTSCHEGFSHKYDWKRHEETYQERWETYQCDLCNKTYFLDKDFIHHHREGHRCRTCIDNNHVGAARRQRRRRTGWGCGFCLHFDTNWIDRCSHVAWHFERNGDTMDKWSQSQVIWSLLQRPCLSEQWYRLIETKREPNPYFGWSREWAGRAEGYPDSDRPPQLQDLLEFYTPDQDAAALVALAYETGHAPRKHQRRDKHFPITSYSPPNDKDLPPLPPKESPPVPPKDFHVLSTTAPHDSNAHFVPWERLMNTIPEDEFLPHSVPLDFSELDLGTMDVDMSTHFHIP